MITNNSDNIILEPSMIVNKFQEYFEKLLSNKNNSSRNDNNEKYKEFVYYTAKPELSNIKK